MTTTRRNFLVAAAAIGAALLLPPGSVAHAGSIVITITENGFGNLSRTYTIADADLVRLRAAYQVAANAAIGAPATRAQVLNYWIMNELITQTIENVRNYERQTAIDALPTPSPINPQ